MKPFILKYLTLCILSLSIFATMFSSCSNETEIYSPQPYGFDATFVVSAAVRSNFATRAIVEGGNHDNEVREITILFFDNNSKYQRFVRTTSLQSVPTGTGNENRWKFVVNLPDGSYTALFLANSAAFIDSKYNLAEGTVVGGGDMTELSMDDIEGALSRLFTGKYNAIPGDGTYRPFVMSSGREAINVPFSSANYYMEHPIRLSRDVAKVNVKFASQVVSDQLSIKEIRLCNYNTVSYAVGTPILWNHWNSGTSGVTASLFAAGAARPATAVVSGYDETNSIIYRDNGLDDESDEIKNNECVDWIFTAERPAAAGDNLCLLIHGDVTINGVKHDDRWYRLDFIRKDSDGTFKYVNILRNYVYTFTINGVGDPGYATKEEAYDALPGNLTTDLTVVDDSGLNSIVYSGQYYLGVTKDLYEFSCISELEQELKIHTDYPGGWKISLPAGGWPSWAGADPALSGAGETTASDDLWPEINLVDTQREFTFTVSAGPLSQ
ncbi:MAG: FimB/Mfa2 family fimbrial subunit, partial [Bacteroidales bacterium]|nr:FimB/Mfa2 family fimbrial subunit [Bacteroidales bacterium]